MIGPGSDKNIQTGQTIYVDCRLSCRLSSLMVDLTHRLSLTWPFRLIRQKKYLKLYKRDLDIIFARRTDLPGRQAVQTASFPTCCRLFVLQGLDFASSVGGKRWITWCSGLNILSRKSHFFKLSLFSLKMLYWRWFWCSSPKQLWCDT